jgi:UDP-N-acetylmuramyl pentapeptide phosphotransferase/UDP-N-acetylglucosamine-1-phosphate transferase
LLAVVLGIVLAISLASPFAVRPLLRRWSVVDLPNHRSSHTEPILRGGGLAPLVALAIGFMLLAATGADEDHRDYLAIGSASMIAGVLGFIEDSRGLRVGVRAGIQLLLGLAAAGYIVSATGAPLWMAALGAAFIAGYINAANFMDGINGISGFHGIVAGAGFACLGFVADKPFLVGSGLVLAMSFAGFLPWNLFGRRMFLGDVGSYLLGAAISVTALAAAAHGIPLAAVIGATVIYLADTAATLGRRVLRGERWFEAHRTHVYQRLTDQGMSHVGVALTVSVFSLATFGAGLLSLTGGAAGSLAAVALFIGISGLYLALPAVISRRLAAGSRLR